MSSKKILYVVLGESINTPLLKRQVLELLDEVNLEKDIVVKIFCFQSLISSLGDWRNLKKFVFFYGKTSIEVCVFPLPVPWPLPNIIPKRIGKKLRPNNRLGVLATLMLLLYCVPVLLWLVRKRRYSILHARSYPAGLACSIAKYFQKDLRFIFDPRSDYVEEKISAGWWKENSITFRFWKYLEKFIGKSADSIVTINSLYEKLFSAEAGKNKFVEIPNNVNVNAFVQSPQKRQHIRDELGWDESDLVFLYAGGIGEFGWHKIWFYEKFINLVSSRIENAKFLFLVPNSAASMISEKFEAERAVAALSPPYETFPSYYCAADVGLLFFEKEKIATATKVGEYLSCGLPVVCNSNARGCCLLLQKNSFLGFVMDLGLGGLDHSVDLEITRLRQLKSRDGNCIRAIAKEIFSNETIAGDYNHVYQTIGLKN